MVTRKSFGSWACAGAVAATIAVGAGACASDRWATDPPASSYRFPVREYAFPSGLRVVIEQDDTTPIAGVVWIVEAGLFDDPPGKSHLAHTVEHLIASTSTNGRPSLWNLMRQVGTSESNAETGFEQTTYHAFVPLTSLDEVVGVLLARMADPTAGIDDAMIDKELRIVAEEMRFRGDLSATAQAVAAIISPADPSARALAEHLQVGALTPADIRGFTDRTYRPERMTLVISGAVGPDWDDKLKALLPPNLRGEDATRRPPVRRPAVPTAPAPGSNQMPTLEANVAGPELWMAWPLPSATRLQSLRYTVLERVADRILTESFDRSGAVVIDVGVGLLTGSQAGALFCRARLRSATDADRARKDISAAMATLSGVNLVFERKFSDSYRQAVREAGLYAALEMQSLPRRALARARIAHREVGVSLSDVITTIRNVSADDVAGFADRWLQPAAARAVLLLPYDTSAGNSARSGLRAASLPADGSGSVGPDVEEADFEPLDGAPLATPRWAAATRRARVTTLANGLTVIAMRRPGLPFVSMVLGFHGEPQPGDNPGVRAAFGRTTVWSLRVPPSDRGIQQMTQLKEDGYQQTMNLFAPDTGNALGLIMEQADWLRVYWPSARFSQWTESQAQRDAAPAGRAFREFRSALFGEHPYHLAPTIEAVRTVTGRDLEAWLRRIRRPNNGALVIVGDIDVDDVSRGAERSLRNWQGDSTPVAAPPVPPSRSGQRPSPRVLFTQDPRRRSTEVRFGCLLPPIQTFAADVRSDALAALVQDDLLRGLRFKLGASYAPNVRASTLRGGTASLEGMLDVESAALPDALDLLRGWLDPARPIPLKPAAIERQRRRMARRSVFHDASNGNVAVDLFYAWNLGWPLKVLDEYPDALARMTIGDLTADLEGCRASAVISILGNSAPPPDASLP